MNFAKQLVLLMTGKKRPSVLMTDGYKFSMAQAGFPLREESFYLTLRRGGPWYIPFDINALIQQMRPLKPTAKEAAFLTANGYGLNPAMEKALCGNIQVKCPKKGSWVLAKEPVALVHGTPSFLASWLEPLAIQLNFPIQVATAIMKGGRKFDASCEVEAQIIRLVADHMSVSDNIDITIMSPEEYKNRVRDQLMSIQGTFPGGRSQMHRVFEVGMRAATCMQQHRLALQVCREQGVDKTSNVFLAWELYMIPVGTTGHEHQERWGTDIDGFRAIRDMRPEPPSYLFDTYDPIKSGIPASIRVMEEDKNRKSSIRCDSGDQVAQARLYVDAETFCGIRPTYIFEDGYDAARTKKMEKMGDALGISPERRMYGYGGYIVADPSLSAYKRNAASAVYKLTESAGARMKFSGTKGKSSLPGLPVIFRPNPDLPDFKIDGIVGQLGEVPPDGFVPESEYGYREYQMWIGRMREREPVLRMSAQTQASIDRLTRAREKMIVGHSGVEKA